MTIERKEHILKKNWKPNCYAMLESLIKAILFELKWQERIIYKRLPLIILNQLWSVMCFMY
jgi:hypothetical protein